MKPGTAGFNGAKLKEAREARGLTGVALAELLGLSRQAISSYENGKQTPGPDVMGKISEQLGFPRHFFLRPETARPDRPVFYRSLGAATQTVRTRYERRFMWVVDNIVPYLRELVDFPALSLPPYEGVDDPAKLREEEIEEIARHTRRHWGLGDGPIPKLIRLLENNGIFIVQTEVDSPAVDAFSYWDEPRNSAYIFLSRDRSAVRSRFNAAHELGHLILHRNLPKETLSERKGDTFRLIENQAMRFAGAFLLPAEPFATELYAPTLDAMSGIEERWLVSVGAMIKRCEQIGLIDSSRTQQLWRHYTGRGWRKREPLDDRLEPESPRILQNAIQLLVDGKDINCRDGIVSDLALSVSDIEDLAHLPNGYLSRNHDQVVVKLKERATAFATTVLETTANVIELDKRKR